jgi:hypothetical protein
MSSPIACQAAHLLIDARRRMTLILELGGATVVSHPRYRHHRYRLSITYSSTTAAGRTNLDCSCLHTVVRHSIQTLGIALPAELSHYCTVMLNMMAAHIPS